jgi:hypothetical protein
MRHRMDLCASYGFPSQEQELFIESVLANALAAEPHCSSTFF